MDMQNLTERTQQLVDSLSGAILATVETAAERIQLAAQIAQVHQRMTAFAAVLEAVGAQKTALVARLETAHGPMKAMLERQIEVLDRAGGRRVGAGRSVRRGPQAVEIADQGSQDGPAPVYVRDGRRFIHSPTARRLAMPDRTRYVHNPARTAAG
jgi:hypothetical protein